MLAAQLTMLHASIDNYFTIHCNRMLPFAAQAAA
jgi:hypothetical protein